MSDSMVETMNNEAVQHVRALLSAMQTWGSWGDGIPDSDTDVGRAYDAAKAFVRAIDGGEMPRRGA